VRVHREEGVASDLGAEPCGGTREGDVEASAGERHRPAIEPRKKFSPGCRRVSDRGRQYGWARQRERPDGPAWSKTVACADAPYTGTGRSRDRPATLHRSPAAGRRGAVAADAHSSEEADEQSRATGGGAGGPKDRGRGKRGPATHAPGTGPGKRVPGAGSRTKSRRAMEEGEVHRTLPPPQHPDAADGVLRARARRRTEDRRPDIAFKSKSQARRPVVATT